MLLTATPINNSLYDFYHLVSFFIKQDSRLINSGIPSIKALFDEANRIDPGDLHPDHSRIDIQQSSELANSSENTGEGIEYRS